MNEESQAGGWLVVITAQRYARERLYAFATLDMALDTPDTQPSSPAPQPGDPVVLVGAVEPPELFGLGVVMPGPRVRIEIVRRLFDAPIQLDATLWHTPTPPPDREAVALRLGAADYARLTRAAQRRGEPAAGQWFVSVALPVEASSRAEAVREFWTYVHQLGPRELPAYVWPRGDELAMQAYLLGGEANLDPEEN